MFEKKLLNRKIAILATDGFEKSELLEPKKALENAGAKVDIVSLKAGAIKSWSNRNWGPSVEVDVIVSKANPADYQGLVLPGGTLSPDRLRMDADAVAFVSEFARTGKPIAAICHGPWTLIETDILDGRTVTSWRSLKTDLINAGAKWVDKAVVVDNGLITSRNPDDLPAFNEKMIEEFIEGKHRPMESLNPTMAGREELSKTPTPSTLH
jgi:protease I